jgi:hypothetical protein
MLVITKEEMIVSGDGSFSYIDELDNNDGVVAIFCTAAFIDDE